MKYQKNISIIIFISYVKSVKTFLMLGFFCNDVIYLV